MNAQVNALESPLAASAIGANGLERLGRFNNLLSLQYNLPVKDRQVGGMERRVVSRNGDLAGSFIPIRKVFTGRR